MPSLTTRLCLTIALQSAVLCAWLYLYEVKRRQVKTLITLVDQTIDAAKAHERLNHELMDTIKLQSATIEALTTRAQ